MIKTILLTLILLNPLIVFTADLNLKELHSKEATILYEPPLSQKAIKIDRIYSFLKPELENDLNIKINFKPIIILIYTDSTFKKMVNRNSLIAAFAIPNENKIVINCSELDKNSMDLALTLKHELVHLILHQYIKDPLLPKWLNEGIAQWVSSGVSNIINSDGNKELKTAILSNRYYRLSLLKRSFPNDQFGFILAYQQSYSFIEYIDNNYGKDQLLLILNKLHNGNKLEHAFGSVLFISFNQLEREWINYLKNKYTLLSFIAENLEWILFFLCALISIPGYIKHKMRLKRYAEEEEEEKLDDLVD